MIQVDVAKRLGKSLLVYFKMRVWRKASGFRGALTPRKNLQ